MEQQGLTRKDLEPYIGSQSKVSEVLNRKRSSAFMIRALHAGLGIPAEVPAARPGKTLESPQYTYRDYPLQKCSSRAISSRSMVPCRMPGSTPKNCWENCLPPLQGRVAERCILPQSPKVQWITQASGGLAGRVLALASGTGLAAL
jgi:HTH-type transcriptional regulator/antitoxin HigA